MLKNFSPRPYQLDIFRATLNNNTLVVLPTGLGKTAIAMMVAARRLLSYPDKKILFLAPTKPLVEQQLDAFKKSFLIDNDDFVLFTGNVSPIKRQKLWLQARFIFSTPQTIENDVLSNKISLEDVVLLIVDEAHRATGDYAYVFLTKNYLENSSHSRVMALTASPGSDKEKIDEVVSNLGIEKIEYRKSSDKEILKFTAGTSVKWTNIILPELFVKIISYLKTAYQHKLFQVKEYGFINGSFASLSKSQLLKLQQQLHARVVKGEKTIEILKSISLLAQTLKLSHAIELAESQTIFSLHEYLFGILKQSRTTRTKAIKNLSIDPNFLSALSITRDLLKEGVEHPKIFVLVDQIKEIIQSKPTAKIIIFSQYRHTASTIQKHLSFLKSELFFGQAKKDGVGLSQKKQQEILNQFRSGDFSCLIATSVAEEGLDIPSVDHVIFYEPVPSAIRSVQRRGRTGRHEKGFVNVLVSKGTRDEAFRWISHHKEKRMYDVLNTMSNDPHSLDQKSLSDFKFGSQKDSDIKLYADFREKGSPVLKALHNLPINLELKQLSVGDFVLSKECCVEYKNFSDFVDSIVDGRLLTQLRSLSQYTKPVIIIEGESFLHRRIDPAAITGMLSTIALSYKIPILRTFSPLETANLLIMMAKKEQEDSDGSFTFHTAKPLDEKQLLEYVVSSFPMVGGAVAKALLERFDSIQAISKASIEELKSIHLIGDKKAKEIKNIFLLSYKEAKNDPFNK